MLEETSENRLKNEGISLVNCGNTSIVTEGDAKNNIFNITQNFSFGNVRNDNLPTIEEQNKVILEAKATPTIEDQKDQEIPTIEKQKELILKLVWKYLDHKDKLNCTLVCKSFNSFTSSLDYFRLKILFNKNIPGKGIFPTLTRYYKTVSIWNYDFILDHFSLISKTLKHLSSRIVRLDLITGRINLMVLSKVLDELPLLESLYLTCIVVENVKLTLDYLPKFLNLKKLHIELSLTEINELLAVFGLAQNIQSIVLCYAKVDRNVLNNFLNTNRYCLESITLNFCHMYTDIKNAKCLLILRSLLQLRELSLNQSEVPQNIMTPKHVHWITDIKLSSCDKEQINSYLEYYLKLEGINQTQLRKYEDADRKEPIIIKTKCHVTENLITKFYHIHYCEPKMKDFNSHDKCKSIPFIKPNLSWYEGFNISSKPSFTFLSIQCRENVNDFKNIKEV